MAIAAALLALVSRSGAAAEDVTGTWLTQNGLSHVRISPCGPSRCGTVVWTKAESRDTRNPDPALRNRNLVGVRIFSQGRPVANGWTGSLYNPLDGNTYTGTMRLRSAAELELSGCVLAGLICQSQIWTRLR